MKASLSDLSPTITNMIRTDHTHVLAVFRRYKPDASLSKKQSLVDNACLALEVHAQLEEEIFYPALRAAIDGDSVLDKSVPEHDDARRLIGVLRSMEPGGTQYDEIFRELIRNVLHHVADEETVLLPKAEELLRDDLSRLGMEMTKRRMQLLKPHAGELVATTARSFPVASIAAGVGVVALGLMLFNSASSGREGRSLRH
jgi:hemerythrin superfamily protein